MKKSINLIEASLKENVRAYKLFLLVIIALEVIMLIYGFTTFNFSESRRIVYIALYCSLLLISVLALILLSIGARRPSWSRGMAYMCIVYGIVLVIWSAAISTCDILGDGYPVTYMTLLAAVGSVIAFHPLAFVGISVISAAGLIVSVLLADASKMDVPFYINFFIFILVLVLVEARMYRATVKQFVLTARLKELATKDGLTTLSNRRSLDDYITSLSKQEYSFTFVLLDIDNFKSINDTYGHRVGDDALVMLASFLSEAFGANVFRYGGDEFAIVSYRAPEDVAATLDAVNRKLKEKELRFSLQVSCGIYLVGAGTDEQKIFEFADEALYMAKKDGKGCSRIFTATE